MEIVEEFIVTLGLDPTKYNKERRAFEDDLRRTKEETRRSTRDMESDTRRATEGFSRLKNEIIGLFLVVAGGRSLAGLAQDLIHGAAETGRFGQAIGMATEKVSVWEMAVQSMGGTAQDARAALAALNSEYTSYMLTGRAAHDADLAAMGISARDLQSPEQLALALSERRNNMTQREFTARLQRMGLPDSFIRTLAQGRQGVEALLDQMQRVGPITERDAQAAIEFERQWSILTNRLRNELRPVLTWLVEHALPWIIENGPTVARVMGVGIAGAIVLMAAALISAAGPIGVVIAGLTAILALAAALPNNLTTMISNASDPERQARIRDIIRRRDALPLDGRLMAPSTILRAEYNRQIAAILSEPSAAAGGARGGQGGGDWWSGVSGGHQGPGGDLARVRATESGGNYNRVVYDAARPPRPLTSMTMGDVFNWQINTLRPLTRGRGTTERQRRIGSTGVGAYQFESGTLAENAALEFGPNWRSMLFNQANQDRVAARLHSREGTRPWAIGQRGGSQLALRGGGRGGAGGGVSVGSIVVYVPPGTPRQQAERVADEIPRAVQRRGVVAQANSGLK